MQTTPIPTISELIHKLRRRLRLSQKKLVAKLDIPFQTVNRWEKGRAKPSPLAMRLIKHKLEELDTKG